MFNNDWLKEYLSRFNEIKVLDNCYRRKSRVRFVPVEFEKFLHKTDNEIYNNWQSDKNELNDNAYVFAIEFINDSSYFGIRLCVAGPRTRETLNLANKIIKAFNIRSLFSGLITEEKPKYQWYRYKSFKKFNRRNPIEKLANEIDFFFTNEYKDIIKILKDTLKK